MQEEENIFQSELWLSRSQETFPILMRTVIRLESIVIKLDLVQIQSPVYILTCWAG